jgi:hypothetical protein
MSPANHTHSVMAGLGPAIHAPQTTAVPVRVDARIKSGHDDIPEER